MLTRRKQQQLVHHKQQQQAKQVCWNFCVDVKIQQPAFVYRNKLKRQRKRTHRLQTRVALHEKLLHQRIAQGVYNKISSYHCYGDLEVVIDGVPRYMWKGMVSSWQEYLPKRRRHGYEEYRKTHKQSQFCHSFPMIALTKMVGMDRVMKITISRLAPARVLYNSFDCKMVLTFWYEPYPFPQGWIPNYRGNSKKGTLCKHRLYFQEKQ